MLFLKWYVLCLILWGHNWIVCGSSMLGRKPTWFNALFKLFSLQMNCKYFWKIDLWFILHKLKKYYLDVESNIFPLCSDFIIIVSFIFIYFIDTLTPFLSESRGYSFFTKSTETLLSFYIYWIFNDLWPKHSNNYIFYFPLNCISHCYCLSFFPFFPTQPHCRLDYHHTTGTFLS